MKCSCIQYDGPEGDWISHNPMCPIHGMVIEKCLTPIRKVLREYVNRKPNYEVADTLVELKNIHYWLDRFINACEEAIEKKRRG